MECQSHEMLHNFHFAIFTGSGDTEAKLAELIIYEVEVYVREAQRNFLLVMIFSFNKSISCKLIL